MDEGLLKYITDVETGIIPTCIHVKNAIKRFKRDLDNKNWVFNVEAADKVVKFIKKLKHFTGKHARKSFRLEPWQLFIVYNLYGFYNLDGTRRFQTAYIEMARKQGKTALVAALSFYHLLADGEDAAEVLLAANSKDQAKIAFNMVRGFARTYDPEEEIIKTYRSDIVTHDHLSIIKTLASDSSKIDGYNCSLGIIDEYHSAPSSLTRDVIRSSQGMRENPMLITITTAGFDKGLPCYELRTVATEIAAGIKEDDSFFGIVYSLDDEDDWRDESVWIKANPNLNITVKEDFIRKQVLQAKNSPGDEVGVKTKNLNMWCDSSTVWIMDDYIIKATEKLDKDFYTGSDVFVGVDLASNVDLTAVAYMREYKGKLYFKLDYYIPFDSLSATNLTADRNLYKEWVRQDYLQTTPGNVTDYDYITKDMLDMDQICDIKHVYYDRYNSNAWAIQCTDAGLNVEPFSQTIGNFNSCTKEFERLILSGKIIIDDSPVTRYCLRNVELRRDFNGNVKPMRSSEKKKIDGVIAMLQALAAYQDATANYKGINIY